MQSPIRALLYGIAIWFVWSLIAASAQIVPTGISGSALFVSMQTVALRRWFSALPFSTFAKWGKARPEKGFC